MKSSFGDNVSKLTKPLRDKIALSIARAVINLVNDVTPLQGAQISLLADETRDHMTRMQEYGFTSVPHSGCLAIAVFAGGDRSNGAVIATDDPRYRMKNLQSGEVAIYTDEGDYVHLRRGRVVEISTKKLVVNASDRVEINAPLTLFAGRWQQTGELSNEASTMIGGFRNVGGQVISNNVTLETHTHRGVQPGSGNTGQPNAG